MFMHHVLFAVYNEKDIQAIQREFTLKDAIWTVAKSWETVTPSTPQKWVAQALAVSDVRRQC